MKFFTGSTFICQGVMALSLLLTVARASALAQTAPAGSNTPAAKVAALQTNLTSAASVTSPVFSFREDIRDNRPSRPLPTHWFWIVIAAGVITLTATAFALRWWIYHGKFFVMRPHKIALQYLEEVRPLIDPDRTRECCLEVSKILRRYLEERFNAKAPRLTTEAFLHELAKSLDALPASPRALLSDFLRHFDPARSAGWYYCRPDLEAMHLNAVEFVRQTAVNDPQADWNHNSTVEGKISTTFQREHRNRSKLLTA